jgi:hypothetical protein
VGGIGSKSSLIVSCFDINDVEYLGSTTKEVGR